MDDDHRPHAEDKDVGHSNCYKVDGPDNIVGTIELVAEILNCVVRGMDWETFESALCILNEAMEEETDINQRASARGALAKAFLTRFACHGWDNDLLMICKLLTEDLQEGGHMVHRCLGRRTSDTPDTVQFALGMVEDVRKAIDETALGTAICVASEALELGSDKESSRHRHHLQQGYRMVRDAHVPRGANDPWAYIRAISLEHIGWTRCVEQGIPEVIIQGQVWNDLAAEEDRQGREQFNLGTELLEGGEFDEAIPLLFSSLSSRRPPHPIRSDSLNNLANALLARFSHNGNLNDLGQCIMLHREALGLRPSPHPDRSSSLNNLSGALSTQFGHTGNFDDLEQCIVLNREALPLGLIPHLHPNRSGLLNDLGNALSTRFKQTGSFDDLEECTALHRKALALTPSHPSRSASLNNLANALFTRSEFKYTGSFDDLDESIVLEREALALMLPPHPSRFALLNNLANALYTRFDHKGNFDNLEECIVLQREVLALTLPPHPNRSGSLSNTATALATRFEHKGSFDDLQECIVLHREALSLMLPLSPNRSSSLNNLSNALAIRFKHKGSLDDLDDSILLHREALALVPPRQPGRSSSLNNLASTLCTRFKHKGNFDDLEECIVLHREALALVPPPQPGRFTSLNNLANALSTRFRQKGSYDDLEQCIALHREALTLTSPPHPGHSTALMNLATALFTRFEHRGSFDDLEECIILHREALGLRPPPHPDRCGSLSNFASALSIRFEHQGSFDDLEQCIIFYREALGLMPPSHPNLSDSLNNFADALSTRFKHKGNIDDLEECIVLYREALALRPSSHPDRSISLNNLGNALSTRFKHRRSHDDLEQSIILQKEALALTPYPHPNRSIFLANIAKATHNTYLRSHDEKDLDSALDLLEAAAKYSSASLLTRLDSAKLWASLSQLYRRTSALDAYSYTIALLPLLSSLDLTLPQRQSVLVHTKDISSDAVQCAISFNALQTAVVFLSTSRSVFWSQSLQLRSPLDRLESVSPSLAQDLQFVSQRLEQATNSTNTLEPILHPHPQPSQSETLYSLSQQRQRLLAQAREIDGFADFLLPPSFDFLSAAARSGPIVFLNASEYGCDAIVMRQGGQLQQVSLGVELDTLQKLTTASQQLAQQQFIGSTIVEEITKQVERSACYNTRLKGRIQPPGRETIDDHFKFVLGSLWTLVVKPVVDSLGLSKTDTPPRLWWCATGVFSFLPIHAAGSYSKVNGPEDALFQYAISSFIYTPQDLISPPPLLTSEFKMVAVIEPLGGNGYRPLPMTTIELDKIRTRIPNHDNLIEHVGKAREPINLNDVLSSLQECSFAHFGCHGTQHPSYPLDSALVLSGGHLTMKRIIQKCQASNGSLAYLSACQTAKSDEDRPDEALTLAATMMFAGFKGVVGTMWSISDVDAPVVADAFYKHMFRNGTERPPDVTEAAYALHLAVQNVREGGAPFWNWVSYVHFGV
ncbi:mucin-like protein 1 [Coprinopsis marcescibilis]|uniref:Mucin-like protein 1 n=1 Tax=Coprinopsis marcescibilis TaxID=230819 RepID=A0A5C3KEA8_COPMA|nr:mucin-like protein 1 [Coprinopsis marcescibilis]